MNAEEFEIKALQYQTIIEDIYAACCELKQENERLSAEVKMLREYLSRRREEEYD